MTHYDTSQDAPDDCPACRSLLAEMQAAAEKARVEREQLIDFANAVVERLELMDKCDRFHGIRPRSTCSCCIRDKENARVIREWREIVK